MASEDTTRDDVTKSTTDVTSGARSEPDLTEVNSETVREEIDLSNQSAPPPRSGAIPSSYGAPGGTVRGESDERARKQQ
ncbi:MAG TPA: hypothetical protein VMD91_05145 [Candidatus Sulfotelmatobacter sp.]|nr:hypothetical protein [Candidatus Sulfotelmatobacter sp.]